MKIFRVILTLFLIAQAWFIFITFHFSYIGISVEQFEKDKWKIRSFEETNAELQSKLHIGDIIVGINGESPKNSLSIKRWDSITQADDITVLRDNIEYHVEIPRSRWGKLEFFPLIGEAISLLFAFIIYTKVRNSKSAIVLCFVFLSIAMVYMSLGASSRGEVWSKIFTTSGLMLIPVIFYHFLIVFFKEKGNIAISSKSLKYLYGFVVLSVFIKIGYFSPVAVQYIYNPSLLVTIFFFLFGLALNFIQLTKIFITFRKQSVYLSSMIKTIWISLFISFFPFACFSFFPMLLGKDAILDPYYSSWIILFFPISFAYLIISKQLYDIDTLLRRFLFTTIISIVPAIIIVSLFDLLLSWDAQLTKLLMFFIIVLLIFSFVLYSLEYLTSKLEPVVFPRKHQLQSALRKISKNLGSISSFREIKEIILVDIVQTLQVYGGAVVFKYPHHMEAISEGDINAEEVEELLESGWFDDHPTYTCFEINHHEEYTSYLVMTRKSTNTMLGLEDRQWLNLIISYLAVSLENVYLIRKLTMKMQELAAQLPNEEAGDDFVWFRKLMFELQEKERMRIATDLHDTTIQDLFFLKKRFAGIMDKLKMNPEQQEQFRSVIEFVEIINTNLRQSCFDLHPHLIQEIGLVQTVEKLVERESYESSIEIQFHAERTNLIEKQDLDTKRHLFRMIQEMITNAKKHSHANRVNIQLVTTNDTFSLLYEDNGVGFDEGQLVKKQIGASGIGMEQIKSRTLYLNGNYHLQTSKGSGVKIQITIPMREGLTA
jgi:two-component system sensor histidine kinase ComP